MEAALGLRVDVAVLDVDLGAHLLKAADMEINRPRADGAAARERDHGDALAGEDGAKRHDGGAHGLHELIGCHVVAYPALYGDVVALHHAGLAGELEKPQGSLNIAEHRDIVEDDVVIREYRAEKDGERRVLCP